MCVCAHTHTHANAYAYARARMHVGAPISHDDARAHVALNDVVLQGAARHFLHPHPVAAAVADVVAVEERVAVCRV